MQENQEGFQPVLINQLTTSTESAQGSDGGSGSAGVLRVLSLDSEALVERFLREADIAPSTKASYRRALRCFFRWYDERGGGDLAAVDILAYKQYQLGRVQAGTAGTYLTAVKSLFKWLAATKTYPDVAAGVKGVKMPKGHRKDALTPAQARRVLRSLKGDTLRAKRDYALFNLLLRGGLRTIEVERALVGDIRNKGEATVLHVQGKGRVAKDEFVVLAERTVEPIYDYLAARRASGTEAVTLESPLFVSLSNKTYGQRLATRSIREIVKRALRDAGLDSDRLTSHSLRHTAVTAALLGGASIQQTQAMARHGSVSTTMIYAHNVERIGSNAAERAADDYLGDA